MNIATKLPSTKHLLIATVMAFFMLLTRGSHSLTPFSLPDTSLVLFLLGGLWLKRWSWFATFFALATVIDFGAAALDPAQGFCLTNGYWGLIPSYGAMWLGGLWLGKQNLANQQDIFATKNIIAYSAASMLTTFIAFVISTQTYYLFSGRFPAQGVIESMKHGWEYLPSWMCYSMMYFAIVWLGFALLRSIKTAQISKI